MLIGLGCGTVYKKILIYGALLILFSHVVTSLNISLPEPVREWYISNNIVSYYTSNWSYINDSGNYLDVRREFCLNKSQRQKCFDLMLIDDYSKYSRICTQSHIEYYPYWHIECDRWKSFNIQQIVQKALRERAEEQLLKIFKRYNPVDRTVIQTNTDTINPE